MSGSATGSECAGTAGDRGYHAPADRCRCRGWMTSLRWAAELALSREIELPTSHLLWIALVVTNLVVQILCFLREESQPLHWAKKVTTPLLLFSAFLILWYHSGTAFSVASIILLAMGVGEIGMEGSNVVTSRDGPPTAPERWAVTAAGLLFLLVNVFLGTVLLVRIGAALPIAIGFGVALTWVTIMLLLVFRLFEPEKTVRTQMLLYAPGLVVLAAGAVAALFGPPSRLGVAAILLTVSDSLVLIRLGAGFDKATSSGRRNLFVLMVVILLLYYVYMGVLISTGSPFASGSSPSLA
jgi:hypothetical protein